MKCQHLIAITTPVSLLEIKEYIDIALVSSSYDISTALYLSADILAVIQSESSVELIQSFNMLSEFSIPLYSECSAELFNVNLNATSLLSLKNISDHYFIF